MTLLLFKALNENRLVGSICKKCGHAHFPPLEKCPKCRGENEIVDVPKQGVVLTYSEVYVSNGVFETPYTVAIAQFGAFKIPGRVLSKINIGDPVQWEIIEIKRTPGRWYIFKRI